MISQLLLKPKDAAKLLNLSERTLWALTHDGEIPVIRVGPKKRHKRYRLADLERWVEAQGQSDATVDNISNKA
jgi:excisionase family DNA binding protein